MFAHSPRLSRWNHSPPLLFSAKRHRWLIDGERDQCFSPLFGAVACSQVNVPLYFPPQHRCATEFVFAKQMSDVAARSETGALAIGSSRLWSSAEEKEEKRTVWSATANQRFWHAHETHTHTEWQNQSAVSRQHAVSASSDWVELDCSVFGGAGGAPDSLVHFLVCVFGEWESERGSRKRVGLYERLTQQRLQQQQQQHGTNTHTSTRDWEWCNWQKVAVSERENNLSKSILTWLNRTWLLSLSLLPPPLLLPLPEHTLDSAIRERKKGKRERESQNSSSSSPVLLPREYSFFFLISSFYS